MPVRIAHLRRDPRNQYTVAYELTNDNSVVEVGFAKCSRKDQFNKKMGNAIAKGRLHKNPVYIAVSDIGSDRYKDIVNYLAACITSLR